MPDKNTKNRICTKFGKTIQQATSWYRDNKKKLPVPWSCTNKGLRTKEAGDSSQGNLRKRKRDDVIRKKIAVKCYSEPESDVQGDFSESSESDSESQPEKKCRGRPKVVQFETADVITEYEVKLQEISRKILTLLGHETRSYK